MRRPWLVYLVTALAACVAGLAIAGWPSGGSGDAVVSGPEATIGSTTPSNTRSPSTTTSTTVSSTSTTRRATTTAAPTTAPPTTGPPTTTAEAAPATTSPPASTTSPDAVATDDPLNDVRVVVANGAGVAGLAGSAAEVLRSAGFGDVTAANTGPAQTSTVHFDVDELSAAAALIIDELDLADDSVGDLDAAPEVDVGGEYEIVVVLGADRIP